MVLKRAQVSRLSCSKARPMAAPICYVKRAKVGPTKIEMMRGETHTPEKKVGKNAHNEDEPVPTQKDDTDDHTGEGEDEVDEGEDDHTSEGEDDVDEVEDYHTGEGEDEVDEGEDDHRSEGEDDHTSEGEDDVDEVEDDHTSEGEDDVDEGEDDHKSEGEDDVDEVEDDHASEVEDDHTGEGEDEHMGEGEDEVDEGGDDHTGEGEDDVDEEEDEHTVEGEDEVDGEDNYMGKGEDDVDEGEDDDMEEGEDEDVQIFKKEEDGGDVQDPSLPQCENDYGQITSEPLKDDHYVGPLETFTITVQGTCLDPFIPTSKKARYWALCSSRGAILHSRLHLHYLPKAAAAAVVSVVELADSIWAATPDLPISTFDDWIADAKELEAAGLDVSFLRERIEQLRAFVSGKQGQTLIEQHEVRRRYGAITRELRDMEGQIGRLMKKKEELGRVRQEVAALLPDLWPRAEACWDAFAELVAASW